MVRVIAIQPHKLKKKKESHEITYYFTCKITYWPLMTAKRKNSSELQRQVSSWKSETDGIGGVQYSNCLRDTTVHDVTFSYYNISDVINLNSLITSPSKSPCNSIFNYCSLKQRMWSFAFSSLMKACITV